MTSVNGVALLPCFPSNPVPVRLAGTSDPYYGRVEVSFDGQWGTICDTYFDPREAT